MTPKITDLTDEEINVLIHESLGKQPWIRDYCVWSPDRKSICMGAETAQQCKRWLEELPEGSSYRDWVVAPFYDYPRYCTDLSAMAVAEQSLKDEYEGTGANARNPVIDYACALWKILDAHGWGEERSWWMLATATAKQRACAFLIAVGGAVA